MSEKINILKDLKEKLIFEMDKIEKMINDQFKLSKKDWDYIHYLNGNATGVRNSIQILDGVLNEWL